MFGSTHFICDRNKNFLLPPPIVKEHLLKNYKPKLNNLSLSAKKPT